MANGPVFEGELHIRWVGVNEVPAVRVDQFVIQGPRNGRYRLLFGQVVEPIILTDQDVERLKSDGTVDSRVAAAVEFDEETARAFFSLLRRHFETHGAIETPATEKDE